MMENTIVSMRQSSLVIVLILFFSVSQYESFKSVDITFKALLTYAATEAIYKGDLKSLTVRENHYHHYLPISCGPQLVDQLRRFRGDVEGGDADQIDLSSLEENVGAEIGLVLSKLNMNFIFHYPVRSLTSDNLFALVYLPENPNSCSLVKLTHDRDEANGSELIKKIYGDDDDKIKIDFIINYLRGFPFRYKQLIEDDVYTSVDMDKNSAYEFLMKGINVHGDIEEQIMEYGIEYNNKKTNASAFNISLSASYALLLLQLISIVLLIHVISRIRILRAQLTVDECHLWMLTSFLVNRRSSVLSLVIRTFEGFCGIVGYCLVMFAPLISCLLLNRVIDNNADNYWEINVAWGFSIFAGFIAVIGIVQLVSSFYNIVGKIKL
ncbi:hypothetical protein [Glaciecola sp. 1036]|uniref:hypothetical protein n=1 Tax=Alteromonadaceae TaxID=72275 RepID=UPI003D038580